MIEILLASMLFATIPPMEPNLTVYAEPVEIVEMEEHLDNSDKLVVDNINSEIDESEHLHDAYVEMYAFPEDERITVGICECGDEVMMIDFEDTNPWEGEEDLTEEEEDDAPDLPVAYVWDGEEDEELS